MSVWRAMVNDAVNTNTVSLYQDVGDIHVVI